MGQTMATTVAEMAANSAGSSSDTKTPVICRRKMNTSDVAIMPMTIIR